jgi:hypothetical protein
VVLKAAEKSVEGSAFGSLKHAEENRGGGALEKGSLALEGAGVHVFMQFKTQSTLL